MKKKVFFIYLLLMTPFFLAAQITLIPDANFEQALIDLGIDSDGIINGQVATADIENVTSLVIRKLGILDLTGIEDFAALELLDCDSNGLSSLNVSNNSNLIDLDCGYNQIENLNLTNASNLRILNCSQNDLGLLDVTNNILLETLACGNYCDDCFPQNHFTTFDFSNNVALISIDAPFLTGLENLDCSNNPNLEGLYITDANLDFVNLKNGSNAILLNVAILFNQGPFCIQVDDAMAANNGEPPYGNWLLGGGGQITFSEDCSLGLEDYSLNNISLYPNPVKDVLQISNQNGIKIQNITFSDASGRLIFTKMLPAYSLNVKHLNEGLYIISLETDEGVLITKLVKD